MASQKIRIKLMSYDSEMLDTATSRIVETMKKSGAKISGPIPLPTEKEVAQYVKDYIDDVDQTNGFVFNRWVADQYLAGKAIDWDDFI